MKPIKVINSYVYVVYEFTAEKVHGVYINKAEAEGKRKKLNSTNYVAILKKPVLGKERDLYPYDW